MLWITFYWQTLDSIIHVERMMLRKLDVRITEDLQSKSSTTTMTPFRKRIRTATLRELYENCFTIMKETSLYGLTNKILQISISFGM